MSDSEDNPVRALAAAWEAATGVVAEWEQTTAVAREAIHKLASDPAVRAAVESGAPPGLDGFGRTAAACATDTRTTQGRHMDAVITCLGVTGRTVARTIRCVLCAVAQAYAERPGNPPSE